MRIMSKGAIASSKSAAAAFSPSDISNMEFWFDADAMTGFSDDDSVGGSGSEWEDLGSNGYDLAQSTGTQQPKYKTNIQNSKPGVLFDGTGDHLGALTSAISDGFTFVWVWKYSTIGATIYPVNGGAGRFNIRTFSDNGMRVRTNSEASIGYTIDTNAHFGIFYQQGSNSEMDLDATTNYGTYNSGTGSWDDIYFGAENGGGNPFNGYMFEMICYSKQLSATEQSNLETYLSDKWGI